jgi:hypothetical protein
MELKMSQPYSSSKINMAANNGAENGAVHGNNGAENGSKP